MMVLLIDRNLVREVDELYFELTMARIDIADTTITNYVLLVDFIRKGRLQ